MRKALVVLCLLLVSVTASAQTFTEIVDYVISEAIEDAVDLWTIYRMVKACDYDSQGVRTFAMDNARPGSYSIVQVCDLFDAVVLPKWRYYSDASVVGDFFVAASVSISSGLRGDCDDFAIVVASCIRALGGACRIALVSNEGRGHAFAEVYVGTTDDARAIANYIFKRYAVGHVFFDFDGAGNCWLTLDWSGTAPKWLDAYPGKTPISDPSKAESVIYVPIFNLIDAGSLPELAVP
jgi:transglutaminase-like putative cysteine protease